MEVRWSIRDTKDWQSIESVSIKWAIQIFLIFTFAFGWSTEDDSRLVVQMDNVTSDDLGNLSRLGFVLEVHFTCSPVSSIYYQTSKHVRPTLDEVPDGRAMIVCGDGLASINFNDDCQ